MQNKSQNQNSIIKDILIHAKKFLKSSGVKDVKNSHSLDAEIILSNILKKDRNFLISHSGEPILEREYEEFQKNLQKRFFGKPISYITCKKYFFNNEFIVNKNTLIPREDSEILIEKALEIFSFQMKSKKFLQIADFGAGTGCLGLSFLKEYENAKCYLVEKNLFAAQAILQNAKKLSLEGKISLFHGSWNDFEKNFNNHKLDLIFSNPPYISHKNKGRIMKPVSFFEPHYALFDKNQSNENQNSTYQQILFRSEKILKKNGYLIFEIDEKNLNILYSKNKFRLIGIYNDLYGFPRCMILKKIF